eukprot:18923_1
MFINLRFQYFIWFTLSIELVVSASTERIWAYWQRLDGNSWTGNIDYTPQVQNSKCPAKGSPFCPLLSDVGYVQHDAPTTGFHSVELLWYMSAYSMASNGADSCSILYSVDNGNSWTNIISTTINRDTMAAQPPLNDPSATNLSSVIVRLELAGSGNQQCYYSNLVLYGTSITPNPSPSPTVPPSITTSVPSRSPTALPSYPPTSFPSAASHPPTSFPTTAVPSHLTYPPTTSGPSHHPTSALPSSASDISGKDESTPADDRNAWLEIAIIIIITIAIAITCACIWCLWKNRKAQHTVDSLEKQQEEGENNLDLVAVWLRSTVGLPQYYSMFIQNGYNALDFIANISDKSELSEIGITIKGHQTQIMAHIAQLKQAKIDEVCDEDELQSEGKNANRNASLEMTEGTKTTQSKREPPPTTSGDV